MSKTEQIVYMIISTCIVAGIVLAVMANNWLAAVWGAAAGTWCLASYVDSIRGVLAVHEEAIKTGKWNGSAAWSAAESAARSAWSAARSAWSAESAARSAARSAAYKRYAKELLRLLEQSNAQ